jgi:hypothetical protein
MNAHQDAEPLFGSIQEMIDAQAAKNIQHAADAAREVVLQFEAEGAALAPGVEEALAWKLLQQLNALLPRAESIERDMRASAGGGPTLH